jgi:hypothetical protein
MAERLVLNTSCNHKVGKDGSVNCNTPSKPINVYKIFDNPNRTDHFRSFAVDWMITLKYAFKTS